MAEENGCQVARLYKLTMQKVISDITKIHARLSSSTRMGLQKHFFFSSFPRGRKQSVQLRRSIQSA